MSQETFKQLAQSNVTSATPASIFAFGLLTALDVDTITWQNTDVVEVVFNGTPNLSSVEVGMWATFSSSTNSSNDGTFLITLVNDSTDTIQFRNINRTSATDDEATDSPSVCAIKPAQSVVIKQINVVNNRAGASGYKIYHDDDGTTYTNATVLIQDAALAQDAMTEFGNQHIFSDDALMNIAADVDTGSQDDVTVTVYGFYLN